MKLFCKIKEVSIWFILCLGSVLFCFLMCCCKYFDDTCLILELKLVFVRCYKWKAFTSSCGYITEIPWELKDPARRSLRGHAEFKGSRGHCPLCLGEVCVYTCDVFGWPAWGQVNFLSPPSAWSLISSTRHQQLLAPLVTSPESIQGAFTHGMRLPVSGLEV